MAGTAFVFTNLSSCETPRQKHNNERTAPSAQPTDQLLRELQCQNWQRVWRQRPAHPRHVPAPDPSALVTPRRAARRRHDTQWRRNAVQMVERGNVQRQWGASPHERTATRCVQSTHAALEQKLDAHTSAQHFTQASKQASNSRTWLVDNAQNCRRKTRGKGKESWDPWAGTRQKAKGKRQHTRRYARKCVFRAWDVVNAASF